MPYISQQKGECAGTESEGSELKMAVCCVESAFHREASCELSRVSMGRSEGAAWCISRQSYWMIRPEGAAEGQGRNGVDVFL